MLPSNHMLRASRSKQCISDAYGAYNNSLEKHAALQVSLQGIGQGWAHCMMVIM